MTFAFLWMYQECNIESLYDEQGTEPVCIKGSWSQHAQLVLLLDNRAPCLKIPLISPGLFYAKNSQRPIITTGTVQLDISL